ncbi:hypothetical protein [Ammoniphilus resinae]|uniref:Uncharacterized protein n=1 Tax=Ammoniphilus resinae TaxID=861532 RepID=A0ABS4GTX3_9BACL|nr:hypothetical protein [Ammoniphilus resinae]MBP1933722.1 hypothetical protein [Ammoniphilus resinae]
MNEQLHAIQKKIQSTEEELARLKTQLNTNSTEYIFSTEVLMKRLKDLQELKQSLLDEGTEDGKDDEKKDRMDEIKKGTVAGIDDQENHQLVQQESTTIQKTTFEHKDQDKKHIAERLQLQVSQEDLGPAQIRVRVLTYILHSFQALLDQIGREIKCCHRVEETEMAQIFPESELILSASNLEHVFLLEIYMDPVSSTKEQWATQILDKSMSLLNSLNVLPQLVEVIAEFSGKTHTLLKKWLGFMTEHKVQILISWRKENTQQIEWAGNVEDFKSGLKNLEMIKVDRLEERELVGIIVGMNIRIGSLEFQEMESNRLISAKCTVGKLLQYRSSIGEKVNIRLLKSVVENIQSGEVKMKWIVQTCEPI